MPVPLAVVVPAAIASLAYLNARSSFSYDCNLLGTLIRSTARIKLKERHDRVNLFYVLEENALSNQHGDNPFILFGNRKWTYKEVYDITLKYGAWLKSTFAIMPKEVIAIDFMNSEKFAFITLGLWSIGAIPAFINYNLADNALLHCIRVSTARLIIVDENIKSQFTADVQYQLQAPSFQENGSVQLVFFTTEIELETMNTSGVRQQDALRSVKGSDMAVLMYTSGTTGLPKPAIVSWAKCVFGGYYSSVLMGWQPNDLLYTCMPLYHGTAFLLGFCSTLNAGTSIAVGQKFSTRMFWNDVRSYKATIIQYIGETCRYLLAAPPQLDTKTGLNLDRAHKVRIAFGNGLRPDVWDKFKTRFGIEMITEFYAATDGASASWNLSRNTFSSGAIGRNGYFASLMLGSQLAVVEIDWETETPRRLETGFCQKAKRGEPGELIYKLDPENINSKFQGYFNNKEATEKKILRGVFSKGDAWLRTGDVVRWTNDGLWYFSDRIGDTYRWKGENISTAEVSESLGQLPFINEANSLTHGITCPTRTSLSASLRRSTLSADYEGVTYDRDK
ncbi:MAG: hypothetical protein M1829_004551 [Trizodia sp. TS-e1964]|nr:MAG: hypothetical protein M1829_004551 [Trizodia sp. TS-e1964]